MAKARAFILAMGACMSAPNRPAHQDPEFFSRGLSALKSQGIQIDTPHEQLPPTPAPFALSVQRWRWNYRAHSTKRVRFGGVSLKLGSVFFVTSRGYVGRAIDLTQKDDWVVVAHGGRMPLVLRPTLVAKEFNLVSEAYVAGIMEGEFMDEVRSQRRVADEFNLR